MESENGTRATPTTAKKMFFIRIGISAFAVVLLVIHMRYPNALPTDTVGIGLLIMAVLPWLLSIIAEAEFPGGWKVRFREVAEEQQRQANEIAWIKFLMRNFVTRYELRQLRRFDSDEPFWLDFNSDTKPYFERELRRLLDLNLIERLPHTGIRALLYEKQNIQKINGKDMKDVKKYLRITKHGQDYLKMHDDLTHTD
jgi:hypothetical protein